MVKGLCDNSLAGFGALEQLTLEHQIMADTIPIRTLVATFLEHGLEGEDFSHDTYVP